MRIVARGIIVKEESGASKYLLMSSKKDFGGVTGFYYPIGGGVEPGESQEDALKREFLEEVGIEINPERLLATTPADFPDQEVNWWLCKIIDGELKILDPNIQNVGYFSKEEMGKIGIWPATKSFFKKYIFVYSDFVE